MKTRAFSLMELMVVIAIFLILIGVGVPAFTSIAYSSERATSANMLRAGFGAARDAAILTGRDTAAVFLFEPTGRATIVACVAAGTLNDADLASDPDEALTREVFVPVSTSPVVNLPRYWVVRGYAAEGMLDAWWYEKTYATPALRSQGNWVLPETGCFTSDESLGASPVQLGLDGKDRQTFMIRFEGGTGQLAVGKSDPVLVLAPSPATAFRANLAPFSKVRVDRDADPRRFATRVLHADSSGGSGLTLSERQDLLGDRSSDTVLAKPVGQVALLNERKMARELGVAFDRATESLYKPAQANGQWDPGFVASLDPTDINRWIERRFVPSGAAEAIEADVKIFVVQRYLGTPVEVSALEEVGP